MLNKLAVGIFSGAVFLSSTMVVADEFPDKTIELVIHSGTGGGTDINARMIIPGLQEAIEGNVVVVGRRGGAGANAMKYLESRPADGYTIGMFTIGHAITMARGEAALTVDDVTFLGRGTSEPQVLYTRCGAFEGAEDFIEEQRSNALSYGITSAAGVDDITAFTFTSKAGLQPPIAISFNSGSEVATNVIAGNVDVGVFTPSESSSFVESGDICPMVVVAEEPFAGYPEIPTAIELGIDAAFSTVRGLGMKAGAPEKVVQKLREGVAHALQTPRYINYLQSNGMDETSTASAEEWEAQFKKLVKDLNSSLVEIGYIQ